MRIQHHNGVGVIVWSEAVRQQMLLELGWGVVVTYMPGERLPKRRKGSDLRLNDGIELCVIQAAIGDEVHARGGSDEAHEMGEDVSPDAGVFDFDAHLCVIQVQKVLCVHG